MILSTIAAQLINSRHFLICNLRSRILSPSRRGSTMMLLLTRVPIELLLGIHLTSLQSSCAGINVCLPGWRTKILEAARRGVIEDLLDLLKGLLGGLREDEQHVEEHCYAEDTEHDVDFPSDVGKCGRNEVGKSEVECPEGKLATV